MGYDFLPKVLARFRHISPSATRTSLPRAASWLVLVRTRILRVTPLVVLMRQLSSRRLAAMCSKLHLAQVWPTPNGAMHHGGSSSQILSRTTRTATSLCRVDIVVMFSVFLNTLTPRRVVLARSE